YNKISALEARIWYVLGTIEISRVFVGVDSERQLKEIIAASSGELPDIPSGLTTDDTNLLNPTNWKNS
ncbi:MAG: aldo/keto reductase, partial [Candidatus Neomarinimicrobiota bacterium]